MKFPFVLIIVMITFASIVLGKSDSTQNSKRNTVQISTGKLAYANTLNLPNGLPGLVYKLGYRRDGAASDSRWSSHFTTALSSAALRYNFSTGHDADFYRFNFASIERFWLFRVPQIFPIIDFFLGVGPTLVAEFTYPTREALAFSNILSPFGLWGLNCVGHIQALHSTKKISLGLGFNFSILGVGHVPKPPYLNPNLSQNPYTYFLNPNAAYHFLNYIMLGSECSVSLPHNNHYYSISYIFNYFNHRLSPINQRYAIHSVGLGITF